MRRTEQLAEYEQRAMPLSDEAARDLVRVAAGRLTVSPSAEKGLYLIQARQYVGVIALPEIEILIRPKVALENLFLLLGVGLPPAAWRRETFRYGTTRFLVPSFASFFAHTLERLLAGGLLRSYRDERDRLVTLRGRIDFTEQLRIPHRQIPVACRFDDFTADILENRALKAALHRLLRLPGIPMDVRRTLLRELTRFEEVANVFVDPGSIDRLVYTRLNRRYEPALRLAQMVLRNVTLLDRAGSADASAFLIDMNDLFQRFVTDRLRRQLSKRLVVDDEPTVWLDIAHKVDMRPDLVFRKGFDLVFVADVKYKMTFTGFGRNSDYYQLLAYTTALDLSEGLLIYCQAEGQVPPREIHVRLAGKRLSTFAVDLSGPASNVERAFAFLADHIADAAGAVDQTSLAPTAELTHAARARRH